MIVHETCIRWHHLPSVLVGCESVRINITQSSPRVLEEALGSVASRNSVAHLRSKDRPTSGGFSFRRRFHLSSQLAA
jgi:hypothetical protein